MADNVVANPGSGGATFATDDDGTAHHPYVKMEWGADNTQTKVGSGANAVPIQDGGNSITVDGSVTVSGTATVTAAAAFPVTDNSGSLTVDAPVGTPVFARLSDGATALTTTGGRLSVDASGVPVPVTDNSGSLTVDAPVGTPVFARLSDGTSALTTSSGRLAVDGSGVTQPVSLPGSTKTIKRAVGNASSSGDNTMIAAPGASKVIKVISIALQATGTVNAKATDGAAGTQLTMLWNFQAREGMYGQPTVIPQYHFKCTANTALVLNLSAAVGVGYEVTYWDDDAS